MAITYIGAGTAANAIDGGAISPTLHADTAEGDLILIAVAQRNAGDYDALEASGYTLLHGHDNNVGSVALFGKIAGAGEESPTIDSTDNTSGRSVIGQCATFRGAQATLTGIVAHSGQTSNGSQANIDTPALTVTTDNTVVVTIAMKNNDWNAENPAIPHGTEIGQPERTPSQQVGLVWSYVIQTTAANISAGAVALTENTVTGVSIIVSIKPAAVAAGHPAARRLGRNIIGVEGVRIH